MTTVTERRVVREATTDTLTTTTTNANTKSVPAAPSIAEAHQPGAAHQPTTTTGSNANKPSATADEAPVSSSSSTTHPGIDRSAYLNSAPKPSTNLSTAAQISGILKGGKLWKSEPSQVILIILFSFIFFLYMN